MVKCKLTSARWIALWQCGTGLEVRTMHSEWSLQHLWPGLCIIISKSVIDAVFEIRKRLVDSVSHFSFSLIKIRCLRIAQPTLIPVDHLRAVSRQKVRITHFWLGKYYYFPICSGRPISLHHPITPSLLHFPLDIWKPGSGGGGGGGSSHMKRQGMLVSKFEFNS